MSNLPTIVAASLGTGAILGGISVVMAGGVRLAWRRDDEQPRVPVKPRPAVPAVQTAPMPTPPPSPGSTTTVHIQHADQVVYGGQAAHISSRAALAAHEASVLGRRPTVEVEGPR